MSYDNYFNGGRTLAGSLVNNQSQWRIKAENLLADCNLWNPTSDKRFPLGAIAETRDGRRFRYSKNGAVALVVAHMNASEAPSANGLEIVQTGYTGAVGDKSFDILLTTGHNYAAGELIDGYLYKNKSGTDGTVIGDMYVIKDNKFVTAGDDTVMRIEIADEGGLRVAFSATDELSLVKNPYRDVVVAPTTAAAIPTGVNVCAVSANYYFWAQTRGPAPLITDAGDTVVVGEPIGKPGTNGTAGAGGVVANDGTDIVYGYVMAVGAAGEPSLVFLTLE